MVENPRDRLMRLERAEQGITAELKGSMSYVARRLLVEDRYGIRHQLLRLREQESPA